MATKKTPAKPARKTKPASASMVPELLRRLEALEKHHADVGLPSGPLTASMDKAAASTSSALRNGEALVDGGTGRILPSAFQIDATVFVRVGEQFIPGIVRGVQFDEGSVSYNIQTLGPFLNGVWGGYIAPRDAGEHGILMLDAHPSPTPLPAAARAL